MALKLFLFAAFIMLLIFWQVQGRAQSGNNKLTQEEKNEGWKLLFNGETLDGWRTYQNRESDGWIVSAGELICKTRDVKKRADLITEAQYGDFELSIEWKIEAKMNSGILYHVLETKGAPYLTGPEYQLIDDFGYVEKLQPGQLSGADYDMYPPSQQVVRPVGQYNLTRIIYKSGHVEHWLNGVKVVEFMRGSEDWNSRKQKSKWAEEADYGKSPTGHISLQDHGGGIRFRNIKIRFL
jgi:Domain of Unknown Function (DUF1080)